MSKITAEQVPTKYHYEGCEIFQQTGRLCNCTRGPVAAHMLSDPAIRRLVVEACVASMPLDDLALLVYSFYSVDEKSRKGTERYVVSALCGPTTETPE